MNTQTQSTRPNQPTRQNSIIFTGNVSQVKPIQGGACAISLAFNEGSMANGQWEQKDTLFIEAYFPAKLNCIPNIGDNDSGVILNFIPYNNKRYNLILLLDKFVNEKIKFNFRSQNSLINQLTFKNHTYFFAEYFGIARSSNRVFDLITFAGQKGQNGKGGHSHNDKCSFELFYK